MAGNHNGAPRLPAVPAYSHHQPPSRQPQSPSVVQQPSPVTQPSPSTLEASPRQTPGPLVANNGNASYGPGQVEQPRMRASVACDRCRKSKTKCENAGINSVCKSCSNARQPQTCVYTQNTFPSSAVSGRRESTADGEGPQKKRRRNLAPTAGITTVFKETSTAVDSPLDSPLLTAEVWSELFDIYEKHFAFDFPFFHRRTFLSNVQQCCVSRLDAGGLTAPTASKPYDASLLLAFLTWTARHHPKLVEQQGGDPIATAEFYAHATTRSMGLDFLSDFTMEKVQALLLLGFHEWTGLDGEKGWMRIGNAVRAAQLLRLDSTPVQSDEDRLAKGTSDSGLSDKEQFILQEKQRRTFWSCCLMDRYLSLGLGRPCMINRQDIRIQSICSDNAFRDGRKVRTRFLGESDDDYERRRYHSQTLPQPQGKEPKRTDLDVILHPTIKWEIGESEHEFVWYMPIVNLFGEITKWSVNTGRRQEGSIPPWDDRNRFKRFDDRLRELKRSLPQHLQLTSGNTEDLAWGRPEKYVHIHAMFTLCTLFLYREYLPAAPWGHAGPDGPIDEPKIEDKPIHAKPSQPHYWSDQAKAFCKACRDFSDLLEAVQIGQSSRVIASPLVGYAAYIVGLSMIYCQFFPNYDLERTVSMPKSHLLVVRYLATAVKRFKIPYTWLKHMAAWREYYSQKRTEYKQANGTVGDSPCSSSSDGSRAGGQKDYITLFELPHKQFGTTDKNQPWHPEDIKRFVTDLGCYDKSTEGAGTSRSTSIKHEKRDEHGALLGQDGFVAQGGFTSVNSPSKSEQAHPDIRRVPVDARSPISEYSSHFSPTPYHRQSPTMSIGKIQTYTYHSPDVHHDRNSSQRTQGYSHIPSVYPGKPHARHSDSPPTTDAQKAADRDRIEKEGRGSLGQFMQAPVPVGPSFGPLQLNGGGEFEVWDGNTW